MKLAVYCILWASSLCLVRGMQNTFGELGADDFTFVHPENYELNYGWNQPLSPLQHHNQDASHTGSNVDYQHDLSFSNLHHQQQGNQNYLQPYDAPVHLETPSDFNHQYDYSTQNQAIYPHQGHAMGNEIYQGFPRGLHLGQGSQSTQPHVEFAPSQQSISQAHTVKENSRQARKETRKEQDILKVEIPELVEGVIARPWRFDEYEWQKRYQTIALMYLYKAFAEYWGFRPKTTLIGAFKRLNEIYLPRHHAKIPDILLGNLGYIKLVADEAMPRANTYGSNFNIKTAATPQQFFNWIINPIRNKPIREGNSDEVMATTSLDPHGGKNYFPVAEPNEEIDIPHWNPRLGRPEKLSTFPWQLNYGVETLLHIYAKLAPYIGARPSQTMRDIFDRLNVNHLPKYVDKFPDILDNDQTLIKMIVSEAVTMRPFRINKNEGIMTPQDFVDWLLIPPRTRNQDYYYKSEILEAKFDKERLSSFIKILRKKWRFGFKDIVDRLEKLDASVLQQYVTSVLGTDFEATQIAMKDLKKLLYGKPQ